MGKISGIVALVALGIGLLAFADAGGHRGWRRPSRGWGWSEDSEEWSPPSKHHHHHGHHGHHDDHHHDDHHHGHHHHHVHKPKKIINRDLIHKHFLHIHNIHRHVLNRHKVHKHNHHKHNLHVTNVHEPIVHNYHQTAHKVHPYVHDEHHVIPSHETVYKQHEHHVKAHPVLVDHKGWEAPAPAVVSHASPGWGWQSPSYSSPVALSPVPAHLEAYHVDGGYQRRSDKNVAADPKPAQEVTKPKNVEANKQ